MPPRGRVRGPDRGRKASVQVRGGWDVLPHGLGLTQGPATTIQSSEEVVTQATPPESLKDEASQKQALPPPQSAAKVITTVTEESQEASIDGTVGLPDTPLVGNIVAVEQKKRKRQNHQDSLNSEALESTIADEVKLEPKSEPEPEPEPEPEIGLRRSKRIKALIGESTPPEESKVSKQTEVEITLQKKVITAESSLGDASKKGPMPKKEKRKPKKTKDNPYGLMPGETPFPEWIAPSAEQCEEVYRLLADMHDDVQPQAPEIIPAPSLEIAGCGEVPSVLDALLRTLLSGATTFDNADKMIKGLVQKFGVLEEGIGQGSIDWNKARLSSVEDVVDAIRVGGLGNAKAKHIKSILDMVYDEMIERRDAYMEERKTGVKATVIGASIKTDGQKDLEILKAEKSILSLDHIRDLSVDEAMKEFTKYPGVGVKTAACVILFCLQRPCFAVDTHVDKFSRWLGWVPQKATVDDIFSHLEVRCPDQFKYGLHQLFIRHGKTCGKCRRGTVEGTEEWKTIVCPLEHLLDRFDKRQTKAKPKPSKKQKGEGEADEQEQAIMYEDEGRNETPSGKDEAEPDTEIKSGEAGGLDGLDGIEGEKANAIGGVVSNADDGKDLAQDEAKNLMTANSEEVVGNQDGAPSSRTRLGMKTRSSARQSKQKVST